MIDKFKKQSKCLLERLDFNSKWLKTDDYSNSTLVGDIGVLLYLLEETNSEQVNLSEEQLDEMLDNLNAPDYDDHIEKSAKECIAAFEKGDPKPFRMKEIQDCVSEIKKLYKVLKIQLVANLNDLQIKSSHKP